MNPRQVLPGAEVSHEAQALGYLETCDDLTFDCLIPLVWPLADKTILLTSLVEVRNEPVRLA